MTGEFVTIPQLANEMGLSRIAVYKKVKSGQIPATRIGRNYCISSETANALLQQTTSRQDLEWIDAAVEKVVGKYGVVLKWLSAE
jgi:excisionase family DNA binding protein